MNRWTRLLAALLLVPALSLAPACTRVVNPVTGEREYTTLTPAAEMQIGEEQHPRVLQEFGGAYDDPELQAYVEEVGNALAAVSDLPELDFTFTLLDSDVVNAFALPGGYVYITRGLLTLAENEAEMAGVLGHEIGHVTGRHAAQRQTRATGAGILATIGTIGAAILGGRTAAELAQQVTGAGAQAWVASYSREQEFEADDLGIRYMVAAGYDPRAAASFLDKLHRVNDLERRLQGQDAGPGIGWFATHPATLDRVERAGELAAAAMPDEGRLARQAFLSRIDGMIYGENPAQGFVRGTSFIHPELRFAFEAPQGFTLVNTPAAVIGRSRQGHAMVFDMARLDGAAPGDYVASRGLLQVGQMLGADVSRPRNVRTFSVDGMPAASASTTVAQGTGRADLGLAVIQADDDRAYRFIFLSPGTMTGSEARAYAATVDSFRRLSEAEAGEYEARRIRIAEVGPGETVETLGRRMTVEDAPVERFQILNAGAVEAGLPPGTPVKLVR